MKYLILLINLIAKVYSINQNIIVLPNKVGVFTHIKIKDSFLNFYKSSYNGELAQGIMLDFDEYYFEISKNLKNLINLSSIDSYYLYRHNLFSWHIDEENKELILIFSKPSEDKFMNSTINILNFLGYISNKFYFQDKEKNYFYFGGIPQNITENYNFFSFKRLIDLNFKMEVSFDNGTIYESNIERTKIDFYTDAKYIICFTQPIFNLLKKSILKTFDDEYRNRTYVHDEYNFQEIRRHYRPLPDDKLNTYNFKKEMKNLFPNFTITIGNKVLNLNKYNIFKDHDDIYTDLLIGSSPCDTIRFGKYFFELFDYSEYDEDTEIVKMYLEKNNSVFKEIEINNDHLKYIKTSKFDIFIFCFIIFMVTLFDIIIINKRKKIKYFNNYYEINNY